MRLLKSPWVQSGGLASILVLTLVVGCTEGIKRADNADNGIGCDWSDTCTTNGIFPCCDGASRAIPSIAAGKYEVVGHAARKVRVFDRSGLSANTFTQRDCKPTNQCTAMSKPWSCCTGANAGCTGTEDCDFQDFVDNDFYSPCTGGLSTLAEVQYDLETDRWFMMNVDTTSDLDNPGGICISVSKDAHFSTPPVLGQVANTTWESWKFPVPHAKWANGNAYPSYLADARLALDNKKIVVVGLQRNAFSGRVCAGGTKKGLSCTKDAECPSSTCPHLQPCPGCSNAGNPCPANSLAPI